MIFNAFFKDFPLDCQKYMYHQKTRTSAFGQPIERFIFGCHRYFFVTFREKTLISIIIQFHFTMPHSLYGLRLYKISNEIYFSIMTL